MKCSDNTSLLQCVVGIRHLIVSTGDLIRFISQNRMRWRNGPLRPTAKIFTALPRIREYKKLPTLDGRYYTYNMARFEKRGLGQVEKRHRTPTTTGGVCD